MTQSSETDRTPKFTGAAVPFQNHLIERVPTHVGQEQDSSMDIESSIAVSIKVIQSKNSSNKRTTSTCGIGRNILNIIFTIEILIFDSYLVVKRKISIPFPINIDNIPKPPSRNR